MFKKIIPLILLLVLGAEASPAPKEIKYFVNLNQEFKGVLLFHNKDKESTIKYYNINTRDKIPFYAPSKEFHFTTLNNEPTLDKLNVADKKKHIVYNLKNLSEDALEEADINGEDVASSSIIYNADDLPSEVIEKRPIHTIESLILSIFETKKIDTKPFYLYEPHKNMLIKVVFSRSGKERFTFNGKVCTSDVYVLQVQGRDKRLIRIYTNGGYPLKIESFSKKWSFVLAGAGQEKQLILKNKELAFAVYRDEIKHLYKNYGLKILSQEVENDGFSNQYITKFHVEKKLTEDAFDEALLEYTRENQNMHYTQSKKNAIIFSVDNDAVMALFEQQYKLEDKHHYWIKEKKYISSYKLLSFIAQKKGCKIPSLSDGETLLCKGKEKEVDFKDALEDYYASKYSDFKVKKVKKKENKFDKVTTITYELKTLQKIDNALLGAFAAQALQEKYPQNNFTTPLQLMKTKSSWKIYLDKKTVRDYACSTLIPDIKSHYNKGVCQTNAQTVHSTEDTHAIIVKYLQRHYKDLSILETPIEYGDNAVSFPYLNDLKKVENACH